MTSIPRLTATKTPRLFYRERRVKKPKNAQNKRTYIKMLKAKRQIYFNMLTLEKNPKKMKTYGNIYNKLNQQIQEEEKKLG